MPSGIRATVAFTAAEVCPVVETATDADAPVDSKLANVPAPGASERVSEFTMEARCDPDGRVERIFSHDSGARYRLTHVGEPGCPCEVIGAHGCPVARYTVRDGTLTVVFHTTDYDTLRTVVGDLRERFPDMDVKRFIRSPADQRSEDAVFVDRSTLTTRQLEVLETAHRMGHFERPRAATVTDVAEALEVSPSTASEHLAVALRKVLDGVLDEH